MAQSRLTAVRLFLQRALYRFVRFIRRQPTANYFLVGASIAIITYGLSVIWTALFNALDFNGFAADGAFQLYDPMRRLAAGQVIGRNFNFFHGVGVPLVHFPLFVIFGQGLFGSEMSRWIMSPLAFALVALCFFYAFCRQWKLALPLTAAVMAFGLTQMPFFSLAGNSLLGVRASMPVVVLAIMFYYDRLQQPLLLWARQSWLRAIVRYEAVIGAMLAVSILCGTEFGLAVTAAFVITYVAYPVRKKLSLKDRAVSAGRIICLLIIVLLAALTIITKGAPLEPLIYAFVDIPADQSWYFGVPPNTFLHLGNVFDLLSRFADIQVILLFVIMVALMVWRVHKHLKDRLRTQILMCALLTGAFSMVSMLGYFDPSETYALGRMALLVGAAAFIMLWDLWKVPLLFGFEVMKIRKRFTITPRFVVRMAGFAFVIGALVWSVSTLVANQRQFAILTTVRQLKNYILGLDTNTLSSAWDNTDSIIMPVVQADNTVAIVDVNGGGFVHGISTTSSQLIINPANHTSFIHGRQIVYFHRSGRQIIKSAIKWGSKGDLLVTLQNAEFRLNPDGDGAPQNMIVAQDFNHDNNKLWSLYSTLFESEMDTFNPSGDDYVIHALGEQERVQYLQDFKKTKPEFVVTLSRNYFIYEEWLQNEHWDLYSLIEQNYEVVAQSPIHILWKRKDQPWSNSNQDVGPWHKLDLTIDNSIQSEKLILPKLSFANVPSVDELEQNYAAQKRAALQAAGQKVAPDLAMNLTQYVQYLSQQEMENLMQQLVDNENSGPMTAAVERQRDTQIYIQKQKSLKNQPYLRVPRPKRQVILIHLTYTISNPFSGIPLLGKTTRYFIEENNVYTKTPVSLRPYANQITFPVVISEVAPFGNAYLMPNTYSLIPGGMLHITSAEWAPLNAPVKTLEVLTDTMP